MILEIPKGFRFESDYVSQSNYAYEENGKLIIVGNLSFERMMYDLTYAQKDSNHCYYCGCDLNENIRTIDHQYPRMYGGISLPPNLVPCCSNCNNKKSNLTEYQFEEYLKIDEKNKKKRRIYKIECEREMKKMQYSVGYVLPEEWIIIYNNLKILVEIDLENTSYRGKKYRRIKSYYNKYNHLPGPIIISANRFLLDGFILLMFAKENKISHLPTIILENVFVK